MLFAKEASKNHVQEAKGYAFVNFVTPEAAEAFHGAWHRSSRWLNESDLNVSPAALQGLEANIQKWSGPRRARIRNPALRPFVRCSTTAAVEPMQSAQASPVRHAVQAKRDR